MCIRDRCGSLQAQKMYKNIEADSVSVRYIRNARLTDSYIFDENRRKDVVFVNEEVTTHLLMPENIKLVDISTNKIIGNQCTDLSLIHIYIRETLLQVSMQKAEMPSFLKPRLRITSRQNAR